MRTLMLSLIALSVALAGDFPEISHEELKQAIAANQAVVIDVNGTERFQQSHVEGAIDFQATPDLAQVLPADKSTMIVAYCGGPQCGAWKKAAKAASELGYTNIRHYKAGISGWDEATTAAR